MGIRDMFRNDGKALGRVTRFSLKGCFSIVAVVYVIFLIYAIYVGINGPEPYSTEDLGNGYVFHAYPVYNIDYKNGDFLFPGELENYSFNEDYIIVKEKLASTTPEHFSIINKPYDYLSRYPFKYWIIDKHSHELSGPYDSLHLFEDCARRGINLRFDPNNAQ